MSWKPITNFNHYLINEQGQIYSTKTDKILKPTKSLNGTLYIYLSKNNESTCFQVAKLVLKHFQPNRTETKTYAIHKDFELENVQNDNLERGTRGDRRRMFNEMKKKKRGVYVWNFFSIKENRVVPKFRAMLKDKNGKLVTIGYYKTRFFAEFRYIQAYKKMYGNTPY